MANNWKKISKVEWTTVGQDDSNDTREKVKLGSLQRIADACELMAQNHAELICDRDNFKRWYEEGKADLQHAENSNRSLRGQITKLRKRLQDCGGGE